MPPADPLHCSGGGLYVEAAGFPDSNPALVVPGLLALRDESFDHVAGSEAVDHFLSGPVASWETISVGKGTAIDSPPGASDSEHVKVGVKLDRLSESAKSTTRTDSKFICSEAGLAGEVPDQSGAQR